MKATAKKSSASTKSVHSAPNQAFFARQGESGFFSPAVQYKLTVNKPGDKFEQEADKMAGKVMRMPAPSAAQQDEELQRQPEKQLQKQEDEQIQKETAPEEKIQRASLAEDKLQKAEDDKLQKAEAPEEKIQKAEMPEEKVQKASQAEDKLQKAEDDKLQKAEAPEEKIQKAEMPEEKVQKASQAEDKLQKAEDDKLQKAEAPEEKIQKAENPEEKIQKSSQPEEKLQRKEEEKIQRDGAGTPAVANNTQATIHSKTTGGQPLSSDVRGFMEPRFSADFSKVRVHTDAESASLNNHLGARAFTYQNHIFFSRDQYQPGNSEGKQLLAHELTHTIQQGHAVQRSQQVTTTTTPPPVQRSTMGEILDWIADKANYIPGFRMFTIVLGVNPINMSSVDRSPANILRAIIEFMPGAAFITQALDNHGVFNKIAGWAETQIKSLGMVGSMFGNALRKFIDSLGWSDLAPWNWGSVWDRAKRIFTEPIGHLISFIKSLVTDILKFVKDAILKPLAALAQGTRGYDLLKALLGEDPITGEPVPRTADTLIGGFMKLIGQEEIWLNIKRGHAVARAWAWFHGALAGLLGFARAIPGRIVATLRSLTFQDIITVAGAFTKIVGAFANIAGQFISWAFRQVVSLLEILFSVVAPGVMPYIKKARAAFVTILKNPIGFVGNLVRAGKQGFEMFASHIGQHLKTALIKWIVGPLAAAGVYIPKSFSLLEIIKLVLSVLGLTWQNIRAKLVKIIPEPVLVVLEKSVGILVTLVREGPVAAWKQIKAELSELKDQLISQVIEMVTSEIVKAAVVKLVSMLNPAGAVVQAIIAIYKTITFFIEKIHQIAAVVASFIDSISAIAAGHVANAAKKVEQTMANTLTVVIAFLAKFAGLGGIPKKIVGIIQKIRKPIDKGMDKIVGWLGKILKKMASKVAQVGVPKDPHERLRRAALASVSVAQRLTGRLTKPILQGALAAIKTRYGLKKLAPYQKGGSWWVKIEINPGTDQNLGVSSSTATETAQDSDTVPTQVPVGSWVKIIKSNSFEQVSNSATLLRRNAAGKTQAVRFLTDNPDGGTGSYAYAKEGVDWARSNFSHASKFVMPIGGAKFILKPKYRGKDYIRPNFYMDSSTSRQAIVNSKLPSLKYPADSSKFLSEGSPGDEAMEGYTLTFNGRAIVPRSVASPDHDPPIAAHWSGTGNKVNQRSRENWNNSLSTYKVMSFSLNRRLGSRGAKYTDKVGVNFRGPGE